jgi:branched-chain amino acid transport system ATP-binding protein
VTLIGSNGAGKTTTLRALSGLLPVESGSVTLGDRELVGCSTHEIARLGLAHSPEGRRVFPTLSVHDNLMLGAYTRLTGRRERGNVSGDLDRMYGLFPRLGERRRQLAGTLSGGEQQMLAMARALMLTPKVLLLDEPSMGLSPIMVEKIFEVVREISKEGITVLLVEQNARLALQAADRGYVMDSGTVTMEGDAKQMLDDPKVRAAYLGE